jgi:hypothetical protein
VKEVDLALKVDGLSVSGETGQSSVALARRGKLTSGLQHAAPILKIDRRWNRWDEMERGFACG